MHQIRRLPLEERRELLELLAKHEQVQGRDAARNNYHPFLRWMHPEWVDGAHIRQIGKIFDSIVSGELKRVMIHLPPRHMKSENGSFVLPQYFLGRNPKAKIIQASNTAELAQGFGRRIRDAINDDRYKELFPATGLKADSKAAFRWHTNQGGEYYAAGVGGALAGRGADLFIVDDPHCLDTNTEIPTPSGFKRMADLQIGDEVFGPDGRPTKVVGVSPVWNRELYVAQTFDGAEIVCDAQHLWTVARDGIYRTLRAEDMVGKKWRLPDVAPIEYPKKSLPIDPYVLGVWLGNGTSSLGRITSHRDDVQFFREEFESRGYQTNQLGDPHAFSAPGLRRSLIDCGLFENKHIPEMYLTASIEQRRDLLRGLMDTDGTACLGCAQFSNTNISLSQGVMEIVRSLGVRAKVSPTPYFCRFTKTQRIDHRVSFVMAGCFKLPRKAAKARSPVRTGRTITVAPLGRSGEVKCIKVDRADGLFVAGRGYVVTHNTEAEAQIGIYNPKVYDKAYEWFTSGPLQRLQPGGTILVLVTRWHQRDMSGRIIAHAKATGSMNEWRVFEFPAILPSGRVLWPEFWSLEELLKKQRDMSAYKWSAQYMQNPTSDKASMVPREDWRVWPSDGPPDLIYKIQSWDTAHRAHNSADASACTTWGVFERKDENGRAYNCAILLDSFADRLNFPSLKRKAKELNDQHRPDMVLIEAKAAGLPLVFELREAGIPAVDFTPRRGTGFGQGDKIARLNSVTDLFATGRVYFMATSANEKAIDQLASFPSGSEDDLVDTISQALIRMRLGMIVGTGSDQSEEEEDEAPQRRPRYY